jgi:hypothetical protein
MVSIYADVAADISTINGRVEEVIEDVISTALLARMGPLQTPFSGPK